jgi:hypothetical protein
MRETAQSWSRKDAGTRLAGLTVGDNSNGKSLDDQIKSLRLADASNGWSKERRE